ncbi:unnamed protein product [Acanthosepion pharaonis]|uniref:Uncharacterized protein n=1 Tax=Acanthosepion pharaonis TaxID=158019 RepID=A0A812E9F6_ACAPH|nr:unnamed protein product [Sepia pharaonis]
MLSSHFIFVPSFLTINILLFLIAILFYFHRSSIFLFLSFFFLYFVIYLFVCNSFHLLPLTFSPFLHFVLIKIFILFLVIESFIFLTRSSFLHIVLLYSFSSSNRTSFSPLIFLSFIHLFSINDVHSSLYTESMFWGDLAVRGRPGFFFFTSPVSLKLFTYKTIDCRPGTRPRGDNIERSTILNARCVATIERPLEKKCLNIESAFQLRQIHDAHWGS